MKLFPIVPILILTAVIPYSFSMNDINDQLIEAIAAKSINQVNQLINQGADVNARDVNENTPLLIAADSDNVTMVKLLLLAGADVNATDNIGFSPLFAGRYNPALVKLLVGHGADVNSKYAKGATILFLTEDPETLKFLIDSGADVNARDNDGETPLYHRTPEATKLLIDHGAIVNVKDNNGKSPLDKATESTFMDEARVLINNGAYFNPKELLKKGINNANPGLVKLALENGAFVDLADLNEAKKKESQTPSYKVTKKAYTVIGRILKCYLDVAEQLGLSKAEEGSLGLLPPDVKAMNARHFAQQCV